MNEFKNCCNSGNQTFKHWLLECPMFNYHRYKYVCLTDSLLILCLIILTKILVFIC